MTAGNPNQSATDRALDLLRDVGGRIGVATEKLWPKAVRYVAMEALAKLVAWAVVLVLVAYVGGRARKASTEWRDSDSKTMVCALSWFALLACGIGLAANLAVYFPRIVEPTGALVFDALTKVTR